MNVKTNELTGAALDWAVATACGMDVVANAQWGALLKPGMYPFEPSTDWSQGGPLIEAHGFFPEEDPGGVWWCTSKMVGPITQVDFSGPTPLIAACRAIVAAKLGDEVDVPDALGNDNAR